MANDDERDGRDLLELNGIGFGYAGSSWAMNDISLRVGGGEMVGIIGMNGAGKSSLLKIAAGIARAKTGTVQLKGVAIQTLSRRAVAKVLGYLPQQVSHIFDYRVEEVVAMGRFPHLKGSGFLDSHDMAVIERCLDKTETKVYRQRVMSRLSGGERQRVLLASVLAQEPEVLLLDEPTTGLDMHHQIAFFSLLKELTAKGMSIVLVSHDLNLVAQFCDRVMLLHDGGIRKVGTVDEVINQETLADIYGGQVLIGVHPVNGKPVALPGIDADSIGGTH